FLTLVPDAQADGQVLLTMAYDDTKLVAMQKEMLGDDGSFVQQPRITGQGVTQQVELRPGEPVVVAGFAQQDDSFTNRRVDRTAPMLMGGSDATQSNRLYTVLMVTALPEEGF